MGLVAIVAIAAMSLAGCFKTVAHYTVKADDTISADLIIAMDKQYTEGMTDEDIVNSLGADSAEDVEGSSSEPYDDGTFKGVRVTFEDQPLAAVASSLPGTLTHEENGTFVFTGEPTDSSEFEGLGDALANAEFSLSITFPGEVTETNGELSGTTVTWDLLTFTEVPTATAKDSGGSSGGGIPSWVWLVLAAVVIGGFIWYSRKKKAAAGDAPATMPEAKKPTEKK